jgi:diacylglycerol O-acyltransferase
MDQAFYKLEAGGMYPVLMAGAMILDVAGSPYPLNAKMIADHLAARMEKVPLMRKKLVQDALRIGNMQLVDDPSFDVRNHITRTVLPAPGGYRELTDCLGEFSAQRLDLSRPM